MCACLLVDIAEEFTVISSGFQHHQPSPGEKESLSKVRINNERHKSPSPRALAAYRAHSGHIKATVMALSLIICCVSSILRTFEDLVVSRETRFARYDLFYVDL